MTPWAPATSPQTTSPEFWSMRLAAQVGQEGHVPHVCLLSVSPRPTPVSPSDRRRSSEVLSLVPPAPSLPKLSLLCWAPSHPLLPSQISAGQQDRVTAKAASVLSSPR